MSGTPVWSTCASVCYGPLTFFLNSPTNQDLVLQGGLDNGPSPIYVNGSEVVANAEPNMASAGQVVSVPKGPFSLSFVACSSDGPSIEFVVTTPFITKYGLTVDFDRTFHRNGK